MGSRLFYGAGPNRREIWGENFVRNYKEIIRQPASLQWTGRPADSEPLRYVYVSERRPLRWMPKFKLWERLLKYLQGHEEFGTGNQIWEYSYDWRQSLLDTANTLGRDVGQYTARLAEDNAVSVSSDEIRYVFLTHSMGGLMVRIALALGALDPSVVDRIVHIGSPLDGSASAFRSAYRTGSLPMMQTLYEVFKGKKNASAFHQRFLETVRSFPSVYQLMPPTTYTYLMYTPQHKSNPLKEHIIDKRKRQLAIDAHQKLKQANQMLQQHSIRVYTIYSDYHTKPTDLEYEVQRLGHPNPGYLIKDPVPYGKTQEGDGTVPMRSAMGSDPPCVRLRVTNVDHTTMCHHTGVINQLMRVL